MKFIVLFGILLVVYLVWRSQQRREQRQREEPAKPAASAVALPQDMVRCPVCSVHLPQADALPGKSGRLYCSHEHRSSGGN